jgi:hypothetical protein
VKQKVINFCATHSTKHADFGPIPPRIMWTAHFPKSSFSPRWDKSEVITKITRSNRLQYSSNSPLSPSNPEQMSSQNLLCGIWPCCQLWWLKTCEVCRALDATHYVTLCMLVFRDIRIYQFAQHRLPQLPWATDGGGGAAGPAAGAGGGAVRGWGRGK